MAEVVPELAGATLVVQFSSSAGLDELDARWAGVAKPGIHAHVWGWASRPIGADELRAWLKRVHAAGGPELFDLASPGQIHYTAAPQFDRPLVDPLAGRRTFLVRGERDTVDIPAPPPEEASKPKERRTGGALAGAYAGPTGASGVEPSPYLVRLISEQLGEGKRSERVRRVCEVAYREGLTPDDVERLAWKYPLGCFSRFRAVEHLRADVRRCFGKAQAEAAHKAALPAVAPSFPDRSVSLREADVRTAAVLDTFASRLRMSSALDLLLQITVGGGKSQAAIEAIPTLLAAARQAGRQGALFYCVPRHDLGSELVERIERAHPGLTVAVWRGMNAEDPDSPGDRMCLDRPLAEAAARAGLAQTDVCGVCPLGGECGYRRQPQKTADVWLVAHNMLFSRKPKALPDAAVIIVDEAFWSAGVTQHNRLMPYLTTLEIGSLLDTRTGALTGVERARLLDLRAQAHAVLMSHGEGGLLRDAFVDAWFTADSAKEWSKLEWDSKPDVHLHDQMDRATILERLTDAAAAGGFSRLRPLLASYVRQLLDGPDARSVNATVQPGGTTVRFEWRDDFAAWAAIAPKLFLDATTRPEVVRVWSPMCEVETIEIAAPHQRVRQVIGQPFGKGWAKEPASITAVADLAVVELAQVEGELLIVTHLEAEPGLAAELRERLGPDAVRDTADRKRRPGRRSGVRVHIAHHGGLTGMNEWEHVASEIIVGQSSQNRVEGERLAEIVKGGAVRRVADGNALRWPTVTGGIRMSDGTGVPTSQSCHPDPLVEALRWSIAEGGQLQADGRARAVRRTASNPLRTIILGEGALPLTVHKVVTWDEARPCRVTVAIAEASLRGEALPLAQEDLAAARPDLFSSADAAKWALKQSALLGGRSIGDIYNAPTQYRAQYRKAGGRGRASLAFVPAKGGRAALERVVGELSFFELEGAPAASQSPAPSCATDDRSPEFGVTKAPQDQDTDRAPLTPPWLIDPEPIRPPSPPPWPGGPELVPDVPSRPPTPTGPPPWLTPEPVH